MTDASDNELPFRKTLTFQVERYIRWEAPICWHPELWKISSADWKHLGMVEGRDRMTP